MGIYINGQESKGPYGYLCLGLSYDWDNEKRILVLERHEIFVFNPKNAVKS